MPEPITLTGWALVGAGTLALATWLGKNYLAKRGIILPGTTREWIKALGGANLETAYLTAIEQSKNPDEVLVVTAALLQAFAEKITGKNIPDNICLAIVNIIDVMVAHGGIDALKDLVRKFPNPSE